MFNKIIINNILGINNKIELNFVASPKKKEKKAGKRMKKSEMSERLISLFHTKPNETFSLKQLSSSLNLTTHPLKMLCADIITEMIEDATQEEKAMLSQKLSTLASKIK